MGIKENNLQSFIEKTNEYFKDMESEPLYLVDYIYNDKNVDYNAIIEIGALKDLWGKDMDEPFIAIEGLNVSKSMITLMSPDKKPTLKITLPNKITIIKFNSNEQEYQNIIENENTKINIIGRCNINEWMGNITPQILLEDYEVVEQYKYYF